LKQDDEANESNFLVQELGREAEFGNSMNN